MLFIYTKRRPVSWERARALTEPREGAIETARAVITNNVDGYNGGWANPSAPLSSATLATAPKLYYSSAFSHIYFLNT